MHTRSVSFGGAVLIAAIALAPPASADTGAGGSSGGFCPSCASDSDCAAPATCLAGECVIYDGQTAALSTGAGGGAGGGAAGTDGAACTVAQDCPPPTACLGYTCPAGATGAAGAPGYAGTGGGLVVPPGCTCNSPLSSCVAGRCVSPLCSTTADCQAPLTCDGSLTHGVGICILHCGNREGSGGAGGGVVVTGAAGSAAAGSNGAGGHGATGAGGVVSGGAAGTNGAGGAPSGGSNGAGGAGGAGDTPADDSGNQGLWSCTVTRTSSGAAGTVAFAILALGLLGRRRRRRL
jgi:MYXO-CTERM domain-containing protein